jgi:hypothetical protein
MLIRMPAPEHIELPNPRRLLRTTAWSMAESVGLPFGTYVAVTDLVSPDAGLLARTAPTRKPLVAQLAAEVVAFKQSEDHHPGLHRFFQGATWFWAGLFLILTLGMAVMMETEPFKLFMLLSTVVTIGLTALGAAVCALWFFAVLRRLGVGLRFTAA